MTEEEEVKAKVFNILDAVKAKKTRNHKPKPRDAPDISQTVIGDKNILAGRDIIHTKKVIQKVVVEVKPGDEHITDAQAASLHEKIQELVDLHNLVKHLQVTKAHFWSRLNRYCHVPKYRLIKEADFYKAIRWCNQQLAILSGTKTAQKKDPDKLRNRQISFIQINIKQLGIESNYRNYLQNTFHKISTGELDPAELKRAYNWVATQKKRGTR
jgi:hypothetical protein